MKLYISNAFSLSMLDRETQYQDEESPVARRPSPITFPQRAITVQYVNATDNGNSFEIVSCIGHPDTARLFSAILGLNLPVNRIGVKLRGAHNDEDCDRLLVGQVMSYDGGPYRLPEGTTELPDDACIEWWMI